MTTSLHDMPGTFIASHRFESHAGATATETRQYGALTPAVGNVKILGVYIAYDAAITGADTNTTTVTVTLDNADSTVLLTHAFVSGFNMTAGVPQPGGLVGTPVIESGASLYLTFTKVATGLLIPGGVLMIEYQYA